MEEQFQKYDVDSVDNLGSAEDGVDEAHERGFIEHEHEEVAGNLLSQMIRCAYTYAKWVPYGC